MSETNILDIIKTTAAICLKHYTVILLKKAGTCLKTLDYDIIKKRAATCQKRLYFNIIIKTKATCLKTQYCDIIKKEPINV